MTAGPGAPELARLIERFERWTGLDLGRGSAHVALERYLRSRVPADDPAALALYLDGIATPHHPEAVRLIDAITVCHSSFYRDPDQLAALASVLAADRTRPAAVWVPGCASGEDAYTIALLAEAAGRRAEILATDLNTRALEQAARAAYGWWSVRELPPALALPRQPSGLFEVPARLRRTVELRRHNLMDPPPVCPTGWDVIVCRNVFMYFERARVHDTLGRLAASLRPGGYLFLGANDILDRPPPLLRFVQIGQRHVLWRPAGERTPPPEPREPVKAPVSAPASPPRAFPRASSIAGTASRAYALFEAGDTQAALALLLELLDADPLCIEARLLAGVAYHLAGDAHQATHALRGALVLAPDLWPAELYLGFALAKLGDHHGARRALRRSAQLAETTGELPLSPAVAARLEPWRVDAISIGGAP